MKKIEIFGANHFETYTKTRAGSRAMIIQDDKILLTHEKISGWWLVPGGGIEEGETPEDCLVREVEEETGMIVRPVEQFLTLYEYYEEYRYISHYFVCEVTGKGQMHLTDAEKRRGVEPEWLPLKEAIDLFSKHETFAAVSEEQRGSYQREYTALLAYMNADQEDVIIGDTVINKAGTQTIETERLILRRFRTEDAGDMYANWASDPEVTRFLTWPVHPNADVTRSLLEEWITHYDDGGYFNWVMELKDNGKAIGNISVVKLNENTKAADMGYCMSRSYWGQGLMPEALKAVMDYLFDVVGLNRVAACHDVNNPKSGRVMDKAGMKQEGILRAAGRNNQGICDEVWHAMIRSDREEISYEEMV